MITVTKVNQKRQQFYEVVLSNGQTLRLSEDIVVRYRLLKGQELSEADLAAIEKEGQVDLGFQFALNYLSYQLRTEKEILTYLKDKEIPSRDRQTIVIRLKELNLVDDLAYAQSFVRTQMRTSDKGPKVLQQKLRQKGVADTLAEEALELFTPAAQQELASKTAEKALHKLHGKSQRQAQQKIHQTLLTKGFLPDTIKAALAELSFEEVAAAEKDNLEIQGEKFWRKNSRFDRGKQRQKTKQQLYQKGFNLDDISAFITQMEEASDE